MTEQSCNLIGTWKFPVQVQGFCPSSPDPFLFGSGIWGQDYYLHVHVIGTHMPHGISQYHSIDLSSWQFRYQTVSCLLHLYGHLPDVFLEVETTVQMATIPATQVYDSTIRVNYKLHVPKRTETTCTCRTICFCH